MKYKIFFVGVVLITTVLSVLSISPVFAKYEQIIIFVSSECQECEEITQLLSDKKIDNYIDYKIYNVEEEKGKEKYQALVTDICQIEQVKTPLLYIDEECVVQKTRLKTMIENLPNEIENYNRGKKNTQLLIIIIATLMLALFVTGKLLSKNRN